ncbi:MAG: leucine-rich repeat protein [Clostridiaceae bacterium]|nr:leucine-rich repeat protein [Clostridiaceae bacterium]
MKRRCKKIGSLLLALCMVMTMLPAPAFGAAGDTFTDSGMKYKVLTEDGGAGTVALTGYEGSKPSDSLTVAGSVYSGGITYTVTEIGDSAFGYCGDLTGVTIPASVEAIGNDAFNQCGSLTAFTVASGNPDFSAEEGVLYDKSGKTLLIYPPGKTDASFSIPASVETIGAYAFKSCDNLESVTVGGFVENIMESAFAYCENLESVTIGSPVKVIGKEAFSNCHSLETITFEDNSFLETIGDKAFGFCTSLVSLDLPDSLLTIGAGAFGYCDSLESISIGSLVNTIGDGAFYVIPKLTSIAVDPDNGYFSAENNVLYDKAKTLLIRYLPAKADESFSVPGTVNTIGESAFYACGNLKAVTVPSSVETIGESAFFSFDFERLTFLGAVPPTTISEDIFERCDYLTGIYVPKGSLDAYKLALTAALTTAGISIDIIREYNDITASFTDPAFLAAVRERMGKAADEPIFASDAEAITELYVSGKNIGSLAGIELFTGLERLDCSDNRLTALDVSGLTELEYLDCSHNYMAGPSAVTGYDSSVTTDFIFGLQYDPGYGIIVGSTKVTGENKDNITGEGITGSISYDKGSGTLTLNNAVISPDTLIEYAIRSRNDIVVKLIGSNRLGKQPEDPSEREEYLLTYGISAPGKSIEVTGAGNLAVYDSEAGIIAENVTVDITGALVVTELGGGAACCLKAEGGALTVQNGDLSLFSYSSNCLYGDSIVINGGAVTALSKGEGQGGPFFAFNNAPAFGSGYNYRVVAGDDAASAREIADPIGGTFTSNKYVRIEPKTSGGGDDKGSDNDRSRDRSTSPAAGTTVTGGTAIATSKASVDQGGKASAAVTQAQVSSAIAKAAEAAAKSGQPAMVEIKVDAPSDAKAVETSIPQASIQELAQGKVESLTVNTPVASMTFGAAALSAISGAAAGEVVITASRIDASSLDPAARQLVGDRPVFDFSVTSGGKEITQFGGKVTVSVPYTPKEGEDVNAIVIYYINAKGEAEAVAGCRYDPASGTVVFETGHFSGYAVGYNKVSFKDVDKDSPYAAAVTFIAARGITGGTGNGNFSPEMTLTRGEFLVMLMRAYSIAPDTETKDNFSDGGNTWYTGYLAAAKRLGISEGVGGNLFAPERKITIQELYTLLYNSLKAMNRLPGAGSGKEMGAYGGSGEIASWAKDAMELFAKAGVLETRDGRLNPAGEATRAEMAQIMYNLLSK